MNKQDSQAEALRSNITELFDTRNTFQNEINQRGMNIIRALGYEPYRWESVALSMFKRGKIDIVRVDAKFEQGHSVQEAVHEFTVAQFENLLSRDNSV